jgi:natural product biosynthesis luciferase-like monooxygenase protein
MAPSSPGKPASATAPGSADTFGPGRSIQFSLLYFSSNEADFGPDKGTYKYRLLLDGAKFADSHDFTAVWVPERHFHPFGGLYPNPSVLASALAMVTERIRLRAGSVVLPMHHPVRVVEEWAVVDNLSRGRVDLSVAAGWNPNDFALAPDSYADRYDLLFNGLETIRTLWRGGTATLRSGVGKDVELRVHPAPWQPDIAIWLTCSGARERFAEAGEHGMNVLTALLFQSIDELAEKIAVYRDARARHGLDPATGHVTLMLHTFVGDDMEEVRRAVRDPFIAYLASSVDLWKQANKNLDDLGPAEREQVLDWAFERYFQTSALFGTPATCAAFVEQVRSAGVDEIASLIDFGVDPDTTLRGLSTLNQLREHCQGAASPSAPASAPVSGPATFATADPDPVGLSWIALAPSAEDAPAAG